MTKEEIEKKDTRNKVIIGLIMVAILVLSTAGYAFFSGSEDTIKKVKYNEIEFVSNENSLWQFQIQNINFATQYNPYDTENISAPIFFSMTDYSSRPLFFSGTGQGKQEIARNLGNFVSRMQEVCVEDYISNREDEECNVQLPIKNCSEENIIIFKNIENENLTEIMQEENCIIISSTSEEQIKASDAFIFRILGIRDF